MNTRHALSLSFFLSLCLHALTLFAFQQYLSSLKPPHFENSDWLCFIPKEEREDILQTTFAPIQESTGLTPEKETTSFQTTLSIPERPAKPLLFQHPAPSSIEAILSAPTFTSLPEAFALPKDLSIPYIQEKGAVLFSPVSVPEFKMSRYQGNPKISARGELVSLYKLPTLEELNTASYSDTFDVELSFLPKETGNGYIFALTLIPKEPLPLKRLQQHITFLIDKSNSIQQGRLAATKAAVHQALDSLSPEDTFNIIAFDGKMEKMSPNDLPCTPRSFAMAEEFLEKITLGSFFSSSDLYRPLMMTVPGQVGNQETFTAILITDAESLARHQAKQALLFDWTQFNQGKVTLHALSMNDPNASALETVVNINHGKLFVSPTHRGLKRKLLKMMKDLKNPIAGNLSCHAISKSNVHLFDSANLYLDQPYVLLGTADSLDDFVFFVQGQVGEEWFNIKKRISFMDSKRGSHALREEWAMREAYHLYENFLVDGNTEHLYEAKTLLPIAFQ